MSTIVEFTVPSTAFALGEALSGLPAVGLTLERIVPTGREIIPFVWAYGDDLDAFEGQVQRSANVAAITELDRLDGKRLYRIEWEETPTNLLEGLGRSDATILEAEGGDLWTFRLRFPDHAHLSSFDDFCAEYDIPIDVTRVYTPEDVSSLDDRFDLTDPEREALEIALDRGYFATPKQVSLSDIAEDLGISRQALSKRVRRGTEKVMRASFRIE